MHRTCKNEENNGSIRNTYGPSVCLKLNNIDQQMCACYRDKVCDRIENLFHYSVFHRIRSIKQQSYCVQCNLICFSNNAPLWTLRQTHIIIESNFINAELRYKKCYSHLLSQHLSRLIIATLSSFTFFRYFLLYLILCGSSQQLCFKSHSSDVKTHIDSF